MPHLVQTIPRDGRSVLPEEDRKPIGTGSEVGGFLRELKLSNVNQFIHTGKGVQIELDSVNQETLLGTSCGKGRKIYQIGLNSWIVFIKRRSGGGEAVWVG